MESRKGKQSGYLEGETIFKKLQRSAFGKFQEVIKGLDVDTSKFTLPRVVVVGGEKSGKSSLLEKITKCHLFPRDTDICTKMPIKLELICVSSAEESSIIVRYRGREHIITDAESLLPTLSNEMKSMGDTIREEEFLIQIKSPHVTTFTLIDLPGIRAYPEDLAAKTRSLVNRYIADPQTLVLCVAPATLPRLTIVESIGMVCKHNKQQATILALTMPDRVTPADFTGFVVDRISGKSNELAGIHLAGCVAVKNRSHDDSISLVDSDIEEKAFFATAFEPIRDPQLRERLEQNSTLSGLIVLMDNLYQQHIANTWKPKALSQIDASIKTCEGDISALGKVDVTISELVGNIMGVFRERVFVLPAFSGPSYNNTHTSELKRAEYLKRHLTTLRNSMQAYVDSQDIPGAIVINLRSCFTAKLPLNTVRFQNLQQKIEACFLLAFRKYKNENSAAVERIFSHIKDTYFQKTVLPTSAVHSNHTTSSSFATPAVDNNAISNSLKNHLWVDCILPAIEELDNPYNKFYNSDDLVESAEILRSRTLLREKLTRLRHARDVIAQIEQYVGA